MTVSVEGFDSKDLEVVVAWAEAVLAPVVEVGACGNSSRRTLALADGEELREGRCTGDRWLVVAGASADVVVASIGVDGAQSLETLARVVAAVVLNNVVLGLRRVQPAVDCEVRCA